MLKKTNKVGWFREENALEHWTTFKFQQQQENRNTNLLCFLIIICWCRFALQHSNKLS